MKFKGTLILLIVAALGVAYYIFVEQPRHERSLEADRHTDRLVDIDRGTVTGITVERLDDTLEFSRRDDGFVMVRPIVDKADDAVVNTLLQTAIETVVFKRLAGGDSPGEYGLERPLARLVIRAGGDTPVLTLVIGDLNVTRSHFFAHRDGTSDVLLLPATLRRYALQDAFDFRDKTVLDFDTPDVTGFELDSSRGGMVWERGPGGGWITIRHGDSIAGDAGIIATVLNDLRSLEAITFVTGDSAGPHPDFTNIAGRASLWLGADRRQTTLLFVRRDAQCLVKVDGADKISLVKPEILGLFERAIEDFRDRRLLRVDRQRIAKMTFSGPEGATSIVKTGSAEWAFNNPELGVIEIETVTETIHFLVNIKFKTIIEEEFTDPASHGFDAPGYQITLFDSEDRVLDKAVSGTSIPDHSETYATSISTGHLGNVDREIWIDMAKRFKAFRAD